eukprot:7432260-Ditylum_brightwellii.AAC.1
MLAIQRADLLEVLMHAHQFSRRSVPDRGLNVSICNIVMNEQFVVCSGDKPALVSFAVSVLREVRAFRTGGNAMKYWHDRIWALSGSKSISEVLMTPF